MKRPVRRSAPRCLVCGRDRGVMFAIFTPRFKPFGSVCDECEKDLALTPEFIASQRDAAAQGCVVYCPPPVL